MKLSFNKYYIAALPLFVLAGFNRAATAQTTAKANVLGQSLANDVNVITTAVPFLLIGPDAREGGLGDAGVASTPDANSVHWNPSKLANIDQQMGISISYAPWLRQLVPDINLAYLSWFYKLKGHQTIGGSLRYFSLGNIEFTDQNGVTTGNFNPNEYALDFTYARELSDNVSVSMSARYIYSNLTGALSVGGAYTHPGRSLGVDISTYYHSKELQIVGKKSVVSFGACISNIGPKISYSNSGSSDFIPTNLRLGPCLTMNLDKYNKISFLFDLDKLLVPTPPVYLQSLIGGGDSIKDGQKVLLAGKDPDVNPAAGMFQSFYDAPGGFAEQIHEINICGGIEYWYDNQFAIRTGFFYESITKGGRQYFTAGAGFKLNVISIDAAYLIPLTQQNPLQNTLRISLSFNFDKPKPGAKDADATNSDGAATPQ